MMCREEGRYSYFGTYASGTKIAVLGSTSVEIEKSKQDHFRSQI